MTLTWTFYPKHSTPVTLTVVYVPAFDDKKLSAGGFLDVLNNTAYVDWFTYRRFDQADVHDRRDAFQRLPALPDQHPLITGLNPGS